MAPTPANRVVLHENHRRHRMRRLRLLIGIAVASATLAIVKHQLELRRPPIPYHTSALSGRAWVRELLNGHPDRILNELSVWKHVFRALLDELRFEGLDNTKHVTLEEQLAIFLYASTTGLRIRHVGERFQRSNETISRCAG